MKFYIGDYMDSKNEREMLEAWIQKFPDERIIEIVNEMNPNDILLGA